MPSSASSRCLRPPSWRLLAVLLCVAGLYAVEYPLAEQPRDVDSIAVGGQTVVLVDWGRVSESLRRDPASCGRDRSELEAFASSPEFQRWFRQRALRTGKIALVSGAQELRRIEAYVQQHGHATALRRDGPPARRTVPLSDAVLATPYDQRRSLRLVFYDDRDAAQRDWLQDWYAERSRDRVDVVVACGWETPAALRRFVAASGVPVSPFPADAYPRQFGVERLPAVVDFPDEQRARIAEGFENQVPDSGRNVSELEAQRMRDD